MCAKGVRQRIWVKCGRASVTTGKMHGKVWGNTRSIPICSVIAEPVAARGRTMSAAQTAYLRPFPAKLKSAHAAYLTVVPNIQTKILKITIVKIMNA